MTIEQPKAYAVDDLDKLNAFCYEKPVSSKVNVHAKTSDDINNIFSACRYSNLTNKLNESSGDGAALLWSEGGLRLAIGAGLKGVTRLFYLTLNGTNEAEESLISYIVNTLQVQVVVKKVAFSLISTDGQFNYGAGLEVDGSGWHFMVVADNHDLYEEHLEMANSMPNTHLLLPKGIVLNSGLTHEVGKQMVEDSKRQQKLAWDVVAYSRACKINSQTVNSDLGVNLMPVAVAVSF